MRVSFVFVGEGPTDSRLVPPLQILCVLCGADEASGVAPDLRRLPGYSGKSVAAQVEAALMLEPDVDIVFVHRDADGRFPDRRLAEIAEVTDKTAVAIIPVVPIQETEAWLLLDEQAIRDVSGNPRGKMTLGLPKPHRVEAIASPKEVLRATLICASDLKGRRLEKFKKEFSLHRSLLFDRLDVNGPIIYLSAWQALTSRIQEFLQSTST